LEPARHAVELPTAFCEWRKTGGPKQPFAFARRDGQPIAFAGLQEGFRWPSGEGVTHSFAIITRSDNELVQPTHDPMPVVPEPEGPVWLGEQAGDRAALLRPPGRK
jgi:putative SOS response-associated peptidase YedK